MGWGSLRSGPFPPRACSLGRQSTLLCWKQEEPFCWALSLAGAPALVAGRLAACWPKVQEAPQSPGCPGDASSAGLSVGCSCCCCLGGLYRKAWQQAGGALTSPAPWWAFQVLPLGAATVWKAEPRRSCCVHGGLETWAQLGSLPAWWEWPVFSCLLQGAWGWPRCSLCGCWCESCSAATCSWWYCAWVPVAREPC